MDPKTHLTKLFREALQQKIPEAADIELTFERPRDPSHGDLATNVAMQLARKLKRKPRELADLLVGFFQLDLSGKDAYVEKMEVAGAGFINIRLKQDSKTQIVRQILDSGTTYGRSKAEIPQKVQVEFV